MPGPSKYPNEIRQREVRLVVEACAEDLSLSLSLSLSLTGAGRLAVVNADTLGGCASRLKATRVVALGYHCGTGHAW